MGRQIQVTANMSAPYGKPLATIALTPTYSGCPAMDMIRTNIRMHLLEHGFSNARIETGCAGWH